MITMLVVACLAAPTVAAEDRNPPALLTGASLRRQLAEPVGGSWAGVPLREALYGIGRTNRVGILLDRRADPDRLVRFTRQEVPLAVFLDEFVRAQGLNWALIGSTIYVGPPGIPQQVQALIELRREEVRQTPPAIARRLLASRVLRWPERADPRELLQGLADEAELKLVGLQQVPHDLWAAARLPAMTWTERMTVVAGQFKLTFEVVSSERLVRLVPLPAKLPQVAVAGTAESISRSGGTKKSTSEPRPVRYTLRRAKGQLDVVLEQLAGRMGLELKIDRAALERSGISLRQSVEFSVSEATVDELFDAVLRPAGCAFRREGKTLYVFPKNEK